METLLKYKGAPNIKRRKKIPDQVFERRFGKRKETVDA